ncbi:MAG: DciA family protein [Candidatus Omnitrophota bacterium]
MGKPVQLKHAINDLLQNIRNNSKVDIDDIKEIFKKNLDKRVLKHVDFVNLKNGVLKLRVDTSVWFCELNLKKTELLKILQEKFPRVIKDMQVFIGELREKI